jgi:hypothetical protein
MRAAELVMDLARRLRLCHRNQHTAEELVNLVWVWAWMADSKKVGRLKATLTKAVELTLVAVE